MSLGTLFATVVGLWLVGVAQAGATETAARPVFSPPRPADNDVVFENQVPVAMRDGTVLYADIYRPVGEGRYPVIVSRTPYSVDRFAEGSVVDAYRSPVFFARRGYVFVYQDARGRYESDGVWQPFRDEAQDGYDTIEWAAQQSWSNGKVGMHGVSYIGTVQWHAAVAAPPHLVTIAPSVASTSIYHDWVTSNGAWRLSFNLEWGAIRMGSRTMQNPGAYHDPNAPPNLATAKVRAHLPLLEVPRAAGRAPGFFGEWLAHPDYDEYWQAIDVEEKFDRIRVPVLSFGGWFDLFSQGTLHGYQGTRAKGATREARDGTHMVIGPWGHWPARTLGEVDFGDTAFVDYDTVALNWYDYWLQGRGKSPNEAGSVSLFVMGANEWRFEEEYPPARARACKVHFREDGTLSGQPPKRSSAPDSFVYDPANPAPDVGPFRDTRPFETRSDVLAYTSAPLEGDLEVIGNLGAVLYGSSDAVDTDWVARLVDVHPDGRAFAVASGILRARYRNGTREPEWVVPGRVYPLKLDLGGTAIVIKKGHRLRVHVTSSAFPSFDRNLNTDDRAGTSARIVKATNSIHHSSAYPSHLVLPVTAGKAANSGDACIR